MGLLGGIGKAIGGAFKGIGKLAGKAAPFAGMIPGIGPLAAGGLGGLGALVSGKNVLKGAAGGALGGLAGGLFSKLGGGGGGFLGKLGKGLLGTKSPGAGIPGQKGLFSKLGSLVSHPDLLGNEYGEFSPGKALSAGMGAMQYMGAKRQRKSAERRANAESDQRQQLMSQVLAGPSGSSYDTRPTF